MHSWDCRASTQQSPIIITLETVKSVQAQVIRKSLTSNIVNYTAYLITPALSQLFWVKKKKEKNTQLTTANET